MTLPTFIRPYIYMAFGKLYGVNFDEMLQPNLKEFRNFNQFFTREIKPTVRVIDEP